ncbi:NmrA family NAD(P)-binding protein [Sphingomonas sp.]|uniref:NmrA family NAD(P)-binding protein n=1 Tax=Sphingomonas sp. TaxID=28214 RepID=UPI0025E6C48B|nr:NmrA family NAD(P)-binding protein [Sphingomonas sp.]
MLLVGGGGMLGSRIAAHLLDQPDARLRLLARSPADAKLTPLLDRGAEVIEGDLGDPASLDRATDGVDVIVSAVQGGPDVIVDGQVSLAEAGKRNGVRRILPSDFALDLFKATPGEHAAFDLRRTADERIAAVGVEQVNILQGAFMWVFMPGRGAIDLDAGTVGFFGDGDSPIEVTSVEDTARMTARVALDPSVPAGKFAIAGDRVSFREAGEIVGRRFGRALKPVSYGSEDDLRAAMAAADPEKRVMLAYLLYMTNGQTALGDLQNERYPDLRLERFDAFIARELPAANA